VKYHLMRKDIQTGDIVLFSGKGFFSEQIRKRSGSKWSHVGIAMSLPEYDMKLIFESTIMSNVADIESGLETRGVQVGPLRERIRRYNGEVAIRHLEVERTYGMRMALKNFRNEVVGLPYEKDTIELLKAMYDGWGGMNTEDLTSIFCSELTAEGYQRMELLSEELPSNEYIPADFSTDRQLKLLKGCLSHERPVEV